MNAYLLNAKDIHSLSTLKKIDKKITKNHLFFSLRGRAQKSMPILKKSKLDVVQYIILKRMTCMTRRYKNFYDRVSPAL